MKKTIVTLALSLLCGVASAAGIGGGVVVGGVAQGWQSDISGKATTASSGNTVAASQVVGQGSSFQHSDGVSGGSASFGGAMNAAGVSVISNTTQFSTVNSYGGTTGNAPGSQWTNGGEVIVNGTQGFASSENMAKGKGNFQTSQIGGVAAIGGIIAIQPF